MGKSRNPRRGSMQFWPRKRSSRPFVRVRSWANEKDSKLLGFVAYKAGMVHVLGMDAGSNSLTKGEKLSVPVTVLECPQMTICGVSLYKRTNYGLNKVGQIFSKDISKEAKKSLSKLISLPNKTSDLKKLTETDFDFLRILVASNPTSTSVGSKKSKLVEIGIGGSKSDQINYITENIGKNVAVNDVFVEGGLVDIHAVTKGKGFQGVTKRYGVPLKNHKSEKGQRGIGNLGGWTPKRVDYRVAQPGKMGYHLRTEYNKQILKQGLDGSEVVPKSGFHQYGLVKNNYVLIKGSVAGPRKGAVLVTAAIRPTKKMASFSLNSVSVVN